MLSRLVILAALAALALAAQPTLETNDGHVYITSGQDGVKQNVTDLQSQTQANKVSAAHAATLQTVNESVHSLDESLTPRLKEVERKAVKSVTDLLVELIDGNKQASRDTDKIVAAISKLGTAETSVKPGVVQFVTNCIPSGSCDAAAEAEINAVVAGPAFEDVAGIYTCAFTTPAKKVLTSPAVAKSAGPEGFALITCNTPKHSPDHVPGKEWTSTVAVTQNGDVLKYGGKTGRNGVKFHSSPPTIANAGCIEGVVCGTAGGAATQMIATYAGTDSGKFAFSLKITDPDTAQKDLKISVQSSNAKYMPTKGISISQPAADGTRVFSVVPNPKEKSDKKFDIKLTVSVEDKWGLKATDAVINVNVGVKALIMKLSPVGSGSRAWTDSGWWDGTNSVNAHLATSMDKLLGTRADVKTDEYNKPIGTTLGITAYLGKKVIGMAVYKIHQQFQGKTLRELVSNNAYTNKNIGARDNSKSSTNKPIRNKYLDKGNNAHDMFIDTTAPLKVRHRGFCGAQDNWARLSTDAEDLCSGGGHTFGGIGGTHRHGSWQVDYEMAPSTGYCAPTNKYGDNSRHRHSSYYVYSRCGGARKRTDLDYVIERGV